ncbi:hypothetical protein IKF87_01545 [Candidatus Saccharibacteria bacterium]|nr:hypothetical protein [Candidatus Saccharibacteria bacterium]
MELKVDRKAIKNGIKSSFGFSDFEEKFGIQRDELEKTIRFLYNRNSDTAEEMIREIAKNEKKRAKVTAKKPITEYKGVPIEDFKSMSLDEFMALENNETVIESDKVIADTNAKAVTPRNKEILLIEEDITRLSSELIKAESETKRWDERSRAHDGQLRELDEKLGKLEADMRKVKEKFDSIVGIAREVREKVDQARENQSRLQAAIDEKRQKLAELKRISVCVYNDGVIAPLEEDTPIVIDDTGADTICTELFSTVECQELRMKDVRTLARLIAIVKNSSLDFEVICDNAELEKAFGALKDRFCDDKETSNE